jgi:hypothetical protein
VIPCWIESRTTTTDSWTNLYNREHVPGKGIRTRNRQVWSASPCTKYMGGYMVVCTRFMGYWVIWIYYSQRVPRQNRTAMGWKREKILDEIRPLGDVDGQLEIPLTKCWHKMMAVRVRFSQTTKDEGTVYATKKSGSGLFLNSYPENFILKSSLKFQEKIHFVTSKPLPFNLVQQ